MTNYATDLTCLGKEVSRTPWNHKGLPMVVNQTNEAPMEVGEVLAGLEEAGGRFKRAKKDLHAKKNNLVKFENEGGSYYYKNRKDKSLSIHPAKELLPEETSVVLIQNDKDNLIDFRVEKEKTYSWESHPRVTKTDFNECSVTFTYSYD